MPRLEGDLELSRAFGDLRYRTKGLIAEPEISVRDLHRGETHGPLLKRPLCTLRLLPPVSCTLTTRSSFRRPSAGPSLRRHL